MRRCWQKRVWYERRSALALSNRPVDRSSVAERLSRMCQAIAASGNARIGIAELSWSTAYSQRRYASPLSPLGLAFNKTSRFSCHIVNSGYSGLLRFRPRRGCGRSAHGPAAG